MDLETLSEIYQLNPWLKDPAQPIIEDGSFIPRIQLNELLDPEWDNLWTILIGPRRAGKTTLGKHLAQQLIKLKKFNQLLYLNCDYLSIRNWLKRPLFISEALEEFSLTTPILFIDEVQRIENPGLLLKAVIDLNLPIKHIATGSSQLEIKSKVQEHLTGRQLTSLILPLSCQEINIEKSLEKILIYGSYPQVICSSRKEIQLIEIYNRYIQKDIIEILKIGNPDIMQQLIVLLAHSSGQLINFNQLAIDCKVSTTMIRNYLNILEQTFVIAKIQPFIGNKRAEIVKNPIYYFIDNGFRNTALRNFLNINARTDIGLLIENFIFQEIYKYKIQNYLNFDIHFWRTKSGAEVDFVIYYNPESLLPIEVKYRNLTKPTIPKSLHSFIEAYQPRQAVIITKDFINKKIIKECTVHFVPLIQIKKLFHIIETGIH